MDHVCTVFSQIGKYRLEHLLKSGEGIETWEGVEADTGLRVIVKTVQRDALTASARLRLEHEAQVLQQLPSETVCPILEVGEAEDYIFLATAKLEGETLEQRLKDRGKLLPEQVCAMAVQLFQTLAAAHERGLVHGDIKPANILLTDGPTPRCTLLDFGLARSKRLDRSQQEQSAGSIRYLAPEQAGVLRRDIGPHSDLFSLGASLFEALTGAPLRKHQDPHEMLRRMLEAPQLEFQDAVPHALQAIVQKLVRLDPSDRYQTAEGALADVEQLLELRAQGSVDPNFPVGTRDVRKTLTQASLVGREQELSRLLRTVFDGRKDSRSLCTVEAPSGGGKSRLLDEFVDRAQQQGAWVLRGQTLVSSVMPFQALSGVVRELLDRAKRSQTFARKLKQNLAAYANVLTAAFPELGPLLGPQDVMSESLGESSENRMATAMTRLLNCLSEPGEPAVVIIDDAQWLDTMTLALLKGWHAANSFIEEKVGQKLTVVVAFRKNEVRAHHPLRSLDADLSIDLKPLNLQQIAQLVESMAGKLPEAVSNLVLELSEGNPFLVCEILTGLVESKTLAWHENRWQLNEEALGHTQSSRKAADSLSKRLEQLPTATLEVLGCGAVLGREFDLDLVCALAKLEAPAVIGQLELARRKQLLWSEVNGERFRFLHDRIREAILDRVGLEHTASLHRAAAQYFELHHPDRFYELAYHLSAGGAVEEALPYALRAAEDAYKRYSLDLAEEYCQKALQASSLQGESRLHVLRRLGEVRMYRGCYPESRASFEAALEHADDDFTLADLLGKLGEVSVKEGRMDQAAGELEKALLTLGYRIPTSRFGIICGLLKEVTCQSLSALCTRLKNPARNARRRPRDLKTVGLCRTLCAAYFFVRPTLNALYVHLLQLNLAQRHPDSKEYGAACSLHALAMASLPALRDTRGAAFARKGLEIQRSLRNEQGVGESLWLFGLNLYAGAHCARAVEKLKESLVPLERTGERWHVNVSANHIALSCYRLGLLEEAVHWAKRAYAAALEIGDDHAPGISLMTLSLATGGGQGSEELITHVSSSRPTSIQTYNHLLIGHGAACLFKGETQRAIAIFESTWLSVQDSGIYNAYMSCVPAWLTTAYRTAATRADGFDEGGRNRWLRRARAVLVSAERLAQKFPNDLPHVLRERGLILALEGRPEEASVALQESIAAAERIQARLEKGKSMYKLAQLGQKMGWPGAALDLEKAKGLLTELKAGFVFGEKEGTHRPQASLSLIERFGTVLEEGRKLATGLSRPDLYGRIQQAATALLRAQECLILEAAPNGSLVAVDAEDGCTWNRTLVLAAVEKGGPVVFSEDMELGRNDPDQTFARSALCAPFYARGSLAGCFYVQHREVDGLFGAEETKLASFISAISGAALENAEGFEQLTELSRTLESRVESRTAELAQTSERLAVTLRSIGEGVIVVSPRGQVVTINRQAERLLGHTEDMCQGEPIEKIYVLHDPQSRQLLPTPFSQLTEVCAREGSLATTAGREIPVSDTVAPIRSQQGDLLGVVLAFRDLTRQKEMETARLKGEKLESLGVLAGGLAHDLNNLLTTIKGTLGLLELDLATDKEYREIISSGLEASDQAAEIAGRLLTFSRGGEPLRKEVAIADSLLESVELACQGSDVHLAISIAKDLHMADVDLAQVRQVFYNVVLNAVQASPPGGIIEVVAENEESQSRRFLKIRVTDHGEGIPAENHTKIFDPFFSTRKLGSGLGLTTSHSIVEKHGGSIKVWSRHDQGTTFEILLPAAEGGGIASTRKPDLKPVQQPRVA